MDLEKLRDVLLRQIADKNKAISSYITKAYNGENYGYKRVHNNILSSYIGNKKCYDEVNVVAESKPQYRAHNYFDLATLYSFNAFLDRVLDDIENCDQRLDPVVINRTVD